MKGWKLITILALLVIIAAISYFKFIAIIKEKDELARSVDLIKAEVARLEGEKQTITLQLQKETDLREKAVSDKQAAETELATTKAKLTQLSKLEAQIGPLQKMIDDLQKGNLVLKQDKETMEARLGEITQEKAALEARMHSLDELKRQIKAVKKELWQQKVEKWHQESIISDGNKGFIVKNGMATYRPKIKIEVISAP